MSEKEFKNLGKRIGNIDELPPELRKQLQIAKTDEMEDQIVGVVKEIYGGMANIDEILVGLFQKFQIIHLRPYISNKLYRMVHAGLIYSVKGKKGVYTTKKELQDYYRPLA